MTPTSAAPAAPSSDRLAWAAVAVGAAAVLWGLARYWLADPEAADRILIVLAAAWAARARWPTVAALPPRPYPVAGLLLAAAGAVAFLPAWFVYLQVGPRSLLLWWEAAAIILAAAGLLLLRRGPAAVTALRFPLLFPLLALPIPTRVLAPTQAVLQDWTTTLAAATLPVLGIEARRDGFVLTLPSGALGVVEACSGVRSVTALVAIAIFLAHVRGFGFLRGVASVALSVPVIVVVNAARVTTTGLLQEWVGPEVVTGPKHDALGFAAVLLGAALVAGLTRLLAGNALPPATTPPTPATPAADPAGRRPAAAAATVLLTAVIAGAALGLLPGLSRSAADPPPLNEIAADLGGWTGVDQTPDPEVLAQLGCDRAICRTYTDRVGHEAGVWVLYWTTATAVRGYHHPDICWPNRGFTLAERRTEPLTTPGGRTIPLTYREFVRNHDRQVLVYWTQEGRQFWTEADERAAATGLTLAPLRWTAERLTTRAAAGTDDRVVVIVGANSWRSPDATRDRILDLAGRLGDEVYRVCPWSDPNGRDNP